MSRRVIIITIVILLLILAALLVYNFFFKNGRPVPASITDNNFFTTPEEIGQREGSSSGTSEFLRPVFFEPIAGVESSPGKIVVVSTDGSVVELGLGGTIQSEYEVAPGSPLVYASLSPTGGEVSFQDTFGLWWHYSSETGVLESLSPQVRSVDYSDGGVMARVEEQDGVSSVVLQNSGASRTIFSSQIPDLEATWVSGNTLALTTTPSGVAPGILYLLNTNTRRLTRLLGGRYGLTSLVSPDREWVLFSETESSGRQVIVKSLEIGSGQEKILQVQTLPEKCVFSAAESGVLYCATFSTNPRTSIMPDDYRKGVFQSTTSNIVRVELETGLVSTLHENLQVDPVLPKLSGDEQVLFFINKTDGALYRLVF